MHSHIELIPLIADIKYWKDHLLMLDGQDNVSKKQLHYAAN